MNLQLFEHAVADGATNMARDEAMMSCVSPGLAALRFYGWSPWCLSLGRNQPAPELRPSGPRPELTVGTDVVRRPTGGRSVFHGPEVTYAFACTDRTAGGPKAVYQTLHRGLAVGLTRLGVRFNAATGGPSQSDLTLDGRACFRDPAPGELTVDGRKLVGSAQWRRDHKLLQHGSILLHNRQRGADLVGGVDDDAIDSAVGLSDLLDPLPTVTEIVASLGRAIQEVFDASRSAPVPIDQLRVLDVDTYRSEAWTWPPNPGW